MKRLIILCSCVLALRAATTTTWEMSTYQDFIKGRFNGVSLDRDGRLTLAPKLDSVFASGQAVIWSLVKAPDGSIYAGTGHRGRVYRIAPNGTSTLVWTADQPEVFAVAVDAAGTLYVATSPDGRIYRMEGDKAVEVFNPKSKYIWSLAFANDGTLYAGTGDPANVYAIDKAGNGSLYYSTGQGHVTSLAIDAQGRLLAGSEPNGILYRISAKDKAFVLYDANLPEIRSIIPMPDGTVYAAALGGALSNRGGASMPYSTNIPGITVTAPATSITVTDTQANPPEVKPKPDPRAAAAQAAAQQTVTAVTPTVEIAGIEKSAIYKINPDNTVETLWSSKDENIYDLVLRPNGDILFGTDVQARIYKLTPDRKPALLAQANEGEATRLLDSGGGSVLAATGETGKLYRLTLPEGAEQGAASGTYESPVHDAGTVARWGRISWRQRGGNAAFQTRTGNSIRPDPTWSDWSAENRDSKNSSIHSPNARYIQWRAELSGPAAAVENVTIAYLPQNNPPVVRSISVQTVPASGASQSQPKPASSTSAYTVTVTDTGESAPSSSGTPTQSVSRNQGSQLQVSWQADDPDGDRLAYSLWFRGEDEQAWKLIRMNMFENAFLIDADVLADGRYYFRVIATDRPSNPVSQSRDAELVSSPVSIDNTPPMVTLSPARRSGAHVEVDIDAVDATSPLRRCEYSVDAGPWTPIEAVDGVTDSQREQFRIVLENMRPGEHLIVVRVYDTANNAGLAKVVVR